VVGFEEIQVKDLLGFAGSDCRGRDSGVDGFETTGAFLYMAIPQG